LSQKQQLLSEVESSLHKMEKLREKNIRDKQNLREISNFKIHHSTGGIFDMVGDYVDYIKIVALVNKEHAQKKDIDADSNKKAEDVMESLKKTKQAMNANLEKYEGEDEEEARMVRDFVSLESEEEFNNFRKEYEDEILENRETSGHFIFDELIEDIEGTNSFIEDKEERKNRNIDYSSELEENIEYESNMQR